MTSESCCAVKSNIKSNAYIVGMILTLFLPLLTALPLYSDMGSRPEEIPPMELFIAAGIIHLLISALYWIGFIKRVRRCLIGVDVGVIIHLILLIIKQIIALAQQRLSSEQTIDFFITAINCYILRVTRQLRKTISDNTISYQEGFA